MSESFSIGSHFEGFVKQMVESGRYASPSEVMRDGLRLMEEREQRRDVKMQSLRASLQDGLDSGPVAPLDMREVRAKAVQRHSRGATAENG